jgi:nitrous oxidase accessory protein NosD
MMNKCRVVGNGQKNEADGTVGADSIITNEDGEMSIKETDFIGNGTVIELLDGTENCLIQNKMYFGTSQLFIDNCTFTQNNVGYILSIASQDITVTNSRFADNQSNVLHCNANGEACFTDCVFNNNTGMLSLVNYTFNVNGVGESPTFINCDMGNSTYNDRNRVHIENSGTGSIFGEGSLTMIVAFVALIVSVAAIIVNVSSKKNKLTAPQTATGDEE